MPATRPLVLALLLSAAPALAQVPQEPTGTFDEEQARYEVGAARKALYLRALSAERFARTRDARALAALLRRYARPEAPEDHVRYLLAGIVGDTFQAEEHAPALLEAARRTKEPADAWLWLQALALEARRDPQAVAAVAADGKQGAFVRAAALEVLGREEATADVALEAVARALAGHEKLKGADRAALLEACAWALPAARARLGSEPFGRAAELVLDALEGKKTGQRTKLVVARALSRALGTRALYLDAASWRRQSPARAA